MMIVITVAMTNITIELMVMMVTMVKMARMMSVTKIAPVQKDSGVGVD